MRTASLAYSDSHRRTCWLRWLASCVLLAGLLLGAEAQAGAYDDFFKAAKTNDASGMRALLRRGMNPNVVEPVRGETGLMVALRADAMDVFEALLRSPQLDPDVQARNGDTALMVAAYQGNLPAVKALLAKSARLRQPGWNALHYAAASGSDDIARLLLQQAPELLDSLSPTGMTPVMMAAMEGHIYTVKLLLDAGADPFLKSQGGMTAEDLARQYGHPDIAEGLAYRRQRSR